MSASPIGNSEPAGSRVLFHTYDWAFQRPGGGEVQLIQTRKHLEQQGVEIHLFDRWTTRLSDYPVVHSFSFLPSECWAPVKMAGCALVVSSIHWPYVAPPSFRHSAKMGVHKLARTLLRMPEERVRLPFQHIDLFFPNSEMEADLLCRAYELPRERMHVVPNGGEERFSE